MTKKVMVVDDDIGVIYTIKRGLEGTEEYEVMTVTSGLECIDLLKNNQIPDLILLDIMMPEMSGWETYKQLKDHDKWKNIPVVFLTARTDRIAKDAGGFLGDDYIKKPFKVPELKQRIEKILKK
jgi:CheY-like chemotaxis protein